MKIIITKTFLKDYEKVLHNNKIEKIIVKVKQKLEKDLIYLKRPFIKIKFNINNISIRLVWKYIDVRLLLFPIFIYKKWDKKNWYNIIWEDIELKILERMKKIDLDLNIWNFKIYE